MKPLSRSRTSRLHASDQGFTLIEMLVVIALIGLIGLFAIPSISGVFKLSLGTATREMASVIKETYNSTAMTKKVHRLVYDFKAGQYWVESGPESLLLDTADTRQKEERRRRFTKPNEKEEPSAFTLDKSVTRKKLTLPRGVEFEDVVTEQTKEPLTEGKGYTHFFPHGIIEQTVIHLKDNANHHVTLVIQPLVGRTHLIERYVKAEEAVVQ
ncbi:MAG: prepilin-type N-terminal cleavage/methylation domain-containing protein [Methylotenera sp.]|nr:prepilin-type N-terminal cleavage/methylation domain-containing protein [Oligoflexia bacterium]